MTSDRSIGRVHALGVVVLLLALAGVYATTHFIRPEPPYTTKYDPEMAYMLNSLAIFKGQPYAYVDHPGTPVEVLGTLLLAVTRPLTRRWGVLFIDYHIAHPELFLALAHAFLTLASMVTVVLMARYAIRVRSAAEGLYSLAVAAAYFAVFPAQAFQSLVYWSHNSFNFFGGTLLLLALVVKLRSGRPIPAWQVVVFGLAAGVLTAVQLYFAAWVLGLAAAFCLYAILQRERWWAGPVAALNVGVSALMGFLVATGPILYRYRELWSWVKDLLTHQGRYGRGPSGFTTPGQVADNLAWVWNRAPLPLLAAAAAVLLLAAAMALNRRRLREEPGWWAAVVGLLLQLGLTVAMIAKHPGTIYLLAVAAILPLLLALALEVLGREALPARLLAAGTSALVLVGFAVGLVVTLQQQSAVVANIRLAEVEVKRYTAEYAHSVGKAPESLTVLWGYGAPSRCYALRFGNMYIQGLFAEEIGRVCPNEWTYDVWMGYVELPTVYAPVSQSHGWDLIIVPERFLPPKSPVIGRVVITPAMTEGYGRLAIVMAAPESP